MEWNISKLLFSGVENRIACDCLMKIWDQIQRFVQNQSNIYDGNFCKIVT